eukprot:s7191_g2.t1
MLKLIIAKVGSEEQLEKEAFRMAAGGEQGCSLASDLELQSQLKEWLEAQDLSEPGLLEVAQAEDGLPVGILGPLPRTPHVFEEQLKWPLENAPWEASLAWVPNYGAVEEHREFEEDVEEGLMAKMSLGDFLDH